MKAWQPPIPSTSNGSTSQTVCHRGFPSNMEVHLNCLYVIHYLPRLQRNAVSLLTPPKSTSSSNFSPASNIYNCGTAWRIPMKFRTAAQLDLVFQLSTKLLKVKDDFAHLLMQLMHKVKESVTSYARMLAIMFKLLNIITTLTQSCVTLSYASTSFSLW